MLGSAGSTQTVSISKGHKNPGLEFKEFGGMLPKDSRLGFSLTLPVILFLKLGKQIPLRDQLLQDVATEKGGRAVEARSWVQGMSLDWSQCRQLDGQVHRGQTAP